MGSESVAQDEGKKGRSGSRLRIDQSGSGIESGILGDGCRSDFAASEGKGDPRFGPDEIVELLDDRNELGDDLDCSEKVSKGAPSLMEATNALALLPLPMTPTVVVLSNSTE